MKYSLSKLRDRQGYPIQKPKPTHNVTLDVLNKLATAFVDDKPIAILEVMAFEAHSAGFMMRGLEKGGDGQLRYQEWFLAYPKERGGF